MIDSLRSAFVWFYCLPISEAVSWIVLVTFVFLLLKQMFGRYAWWKPTLSIVLLAWAAVVVYATVVDREAGSINQQALIPFHSYRAVMNGGNPEILRSNFMNVVLFYPAGLLTAAMLPNTRPWWFRVLVPLVSFTLVSAGLEFIQYTYAMGRVEIDDVIHNSFGALLGAVFGVICPWELS